MASRFYKLASDDKLVDLLRADDQEAYTEIYSRHAEKLYVHLRNKLRDREDAKDIIQEVFTALWNNRAGMKPRANISAYLFAAVRFKAINLLLQRKRFTQYLDASATALPEEPTRADHRIRERELQEQINAEVARLPKKMREIFCLSRDNYLSHREIAERTGLSESTVKKQVNNALKVLRVKLGALLSFVFFFFF